MNRRPDHWHRRGDTGTRYAMNPAAVVRHGAARWRDSRLSSGGTQHTRELCPRGRLTKALIGAVTLVVVGLAVSATAMPPPEPPADQSAIKVLQYNTRGIIRNTRTVNGSPVIDESSNVDPDKFRFLDVLADRIVAERPQVVTLNEICEGQLQYLANKLAGSHPMTMTFFYSRPDVRCPRPPGDNLAKPGGMGMLTLGPAVKIPAPNNAPAGCVLWDGQAGSRVRVCVMHLKDPEEDPNMVPDVGKAFSGCADAGPVILAGDFNAAPYEAAMDWVYSKSVPISRVKKTQETQPSKGRFYEADMCGDEPECRDPVRGGEATAGPTKIPIREVFGRDVSRKIDYVFADDAHFDRRMTARVEDTAGKCGGKDCSDHRMLWANLTLGKTGTGVATGGLGVVPVGPDVLFDFDKAEIRSAAELDKVATEMIAQCFDEVLIEGHTDSIGSPAYNRALSERRAEAVKDYLVEKKRIPESIITTRGVGETQPVAPNTKNGSDNPQGRQRNRRVEITVE